MEDTTLPVSRIQILNDEERRHLLVEWNETPARFAGSSFVHRLIEENAECAPDAVALTFEDRELSYAELNRRANQLARYLRALGVGPEMPVGICLERSPELIVGMLATLKAGGAFLPLDPASPAERLSFILRDAGVKVALTQQSLLEILAGHELRLVCLDMDAERLAQENEQNLDLELAEDNLAYVIYTSGSTGKPKGALLHHRGLSNLAFAQMKAFEVDSGSRVLQFASASFDASVSEIFVTLAAGATLCLSAQEALRSGEELLRLLRRQEVTHVTLPPSVLAVLPETELPTLRTLVVAGDVCPPALAARWGSGRRFLNAYGPTEATVCATVAECRETARKLPIGKPITNVEVYLLDKNFEPVPVGVPGELYIGGAGLGRAYLNRPDLSASAFLPHPFSASPGARLYRTGDLVRRLPDGQIEFLSRIDQQVKVRGFRIELGEIETALLRHPAVREAVVIVREDGSGEKRLAAYVVLEQWQAVTVTQLREHVRGVLPEYMVPSSVMELRELPLLPSGKVNRRGLPEVGGVGAEERGEYVGARSEVEEVLAGIWEQVLGVERVGIHDNFFELGGHSLLAMQLNSRVCQAFQIEIGINSIFDAPTIATLAELIARQTPAQPDESLSLDDVLKEIEGLSADAVHAALSDEINVS